MKKLILLVAILSLIILANNTIYALNNFYYKSIALDNDGQILALENVVVRITIEEGTSVLFQETHSNITTDQFGFYTVEVGGGNLVSGGLGNITTTADKFIVIETEMSGASWVLSERKNLSDVISSLINDFGNYAWLLKGNTGTNSADNFIGTTDDVDLVFRINNVESGRINRSSANTSLGYNSMNNNSGANNIAVGNEALYHNTTGWSNTAVGNQALYHNTFRGNLVAIGDSALFNNGRGLTDWNNPSAPAPDSARFAIRNVAVGSKALFSNTVGLWNTAVGYNAGYYNIDGKSLTALGTEALMHNTHGYNNSAVGTWALVENTTGSWNTAVGSGALKSNVSGDSNTVAGLSAMYYNNGNSNVAMGMFAAAFNNSGNHNTAIGSEALYHNMSGSDNVALGYHAGHSYWYRNYHNNIFIGALSDANYDNATNSIAIGYGTMINANNQVKIGNASTASFYCQGAYASTTSSQPNMIVDNNGQIMRSTSLDRTFNNLTANGNTVIGNAASDQFTVNSTIASSLIPNGTTANLGSNTNRWGGLFLQANSIHIGSSADEGEIKYTTNSHLEFTKPVLTPNSIVSLTGNAGYTGTAENGLVLYVYNTSGTDYTFEGINVPTGQMKIFVYTGSVWVATN